MLLIVYRKKISTALSQPTQQEKKQGIVGMNTIIQRLACRVKTTLVFQKSSTVACEEILLHGQSSSQLHVYLTHFALQMNQEISY